MKYYHCIIIFIPDSYFINFDDEAEEGGYKFLKDMGPPFLWDNYIGYFTLNYADADPQVWNEFVLRVIKAFNNSHFTQEVIESQGLNFSTVLLGQVRF